MTRASRPWRKPRCTSNKAAWATQGKALAALERMAKENAQAVAPMSFALKSSYQCQECGAWHLTKAAA